MDSKRRVTAILVLVVLCSVALSFSEDSDGAISAEGGGYYNTGLTLKAVDGAPHTIIVRPLSVTVDNVEIPLYPVGEFGDNVPLIFSVNGMAMWNSEILFNIAGDLPEGEFPNISQGIIQIAIDGTKATISTEGFSKPVSYDFGEVSYYISPKEAVEGDYVWTDKGISDVSVPVYGGGFDVYGGMSFWKYDSGQFSAKLCRYDVGITDGYVKMSDTEDGFCKIDGAFYKIDGEVFDLAYALVPYGAGVDKGDDAKDVDEKDTFADKLVQNPIILVIVVGLAIAGVAVYWYGQYNPRN